ncbi:MAG: tetratricopeptide repeat protein [Lachnospiraceae bacterium]|nr:tetratricopeptide repeat protein [Lachnospiraceae bacterium]
MGRKNVEDYRIISSRQLVRAVEEGLRNSERFCFILGSGASVSSNIPMGGELEYKWMKEIEEEFGLEEISALAERMRESKQLEYDFNEIKQTWQNAKKMKTPLPSKYYFDIYKLRFFPNHRNGYHYLEKIMADAKPSLGYYPLALMLTRGDGNNLVITTNFDSLVEDALFLYTNSKPLVINHELLAEFAGDANIRRPIVAKVHRGIFFDPLNKPEETDALKGKWHEVLVSVFQNYTPIVIGYGGGDNSLMELLTDENVKMKNGIYWCYMEEFGLPDEKIQMLVKEKKGYFVCTAGFDDTMMTIGNALFPDKMDVHEIELYLNNRTSIIIENYIKQSEKIYDKIKESNNAVSAELKQSEEGFREEIEKIIVRENASGSERQKSNKMTAWDFWRQGEKELELKQYEAAVRSYSNAIDRQSNVMIFYHSRGYTYNKLGENEKGISDYNKAIELKPDYAEAYNNRGYSYCNMGENEKGISDFNKAIELKPDDAGVYSNRGCIYDDMGEYKKAISDYNKAIELKPDYAETYNNRGYSYYNMGEYEKAISDYNKAIELKPDYAEAYNNRGYTYNELGEYEKAISDFDKAILINPNYANPYKHCGTVWKNKKNYKKALSFYNKAIELNPKYKDAYVERAEVYRLVDNIEKATADEEMAAAL